MGGVEYAVPIGVALLLYFLFPAYLKNRQRRLIEQMRDAYHDTVIRTGEASLIGRWFTFPAAIGVTTDYIIIYNVLSLFPDEIPLERLRKLALQYKPGVLPSHPDDDAPSGNILIVTTTEHTYRILFDNSETAMEWKSDIERAV